MSESLHTDSDFRSAISHLHGNYRAEHVHHTPPDALVDDVVTYRMVIPHLLRAVLFIVIPGFATGFFLLLYLVLSYLASVSTPSAANEGIVNLVLVLMVLSLLVVVFGVVALFFPLKEPIAEYAQLVERRGWAFSAAYYWIDRTANERGIAFGRDTGRVGRTPIMMVRHGRLHALIVVRVYGEDLYMGWTMWRARSTVVLIGHFLRDVFGGLSSALRPELRASEARAMREIVHSLVREGVQAAITVREMVATSGESPQAVENYVASLHEAEPSTVDPFRP